MSNNNYKNNHHPLGVPKNLVDLLEASLRQGVVRTRATAGPNLRWTKKSIKKLIKKAFEKTGLHPINRHIFTEEDFAPSKASSTVAHVPSTFPADFPSSDPAEASHDDGTLSESDPSDLDSDFCLQDEEGMSI